jgi:hypothetical protein
LANSLPKDPTSLSRALAYAVQKKADEQETVTDFAYQQGSPSKFEGERFSVREFGDSIDPAKQKGRNEAFERAKTWRALADNFRPVGGQESDPALDEEFA